MTVRLHWFLPTTGDDRDVVGVTARDSLQSRTTTRPPTLDYLAQVARAAESAGFEAVLTPTGSDCEDSWLTTAALLPQTTRLKFLVAFRPGVIAPPLAAQMTATYQRLSGGRLLLNVVTGSDADEQRAYGDFLSHDERYARTGEFLDLLRTAWSGDPYDYEGAHYRVAGGRLRKPPAELPPVFFGGSSQAALPVAAKYADTYLTWGEPPAAVAQKIGRVRKLAEAEGRELSYGIRLHVISRDTAAEAWAEADRILDSLDPAAIKAAHERFRTSESAGQRAMAALSGGRTDRLEIHPNLWAGFGLVRPGAGTALVGSHEQVAERIEEFASLGIEHFILSGQPHLEEAIRFGECVRPLLARQLTAA
ncbi:MULTISPECIES: LLM class flavin-dependent oxidoreductase [unclassified Streptomyces]|uniref:LLM class flavin-dependent oxidoreductase n=1 Tax=unclassified Streptomyces TaxID=2593676 RepID=UPI000DDA9EA7|nr:MULTISPECIES: LLM class flavin-dependent oxidoreductase [unclassified Streptomyces]QZZ27958.1 LLM class flavin-dependent oxidoreductase [Streptomyces sp. ST1015]